MRACLRQSPRCSVAGAARGAYFARVRYQDDGFEAARKLVMLK